MKTHYLSPDEIFGKSVPKIYERVKDISKDTELFINWFNEYVKLELDSYRLSDTQIRDRYITIEEDLVPSKLHNLFRYTWFKFDYFCHTKKDDSYPTGLSGIFDLFVRVFTKDIATNGKASEMPNSVRSFYTEDEYAKAIQDSNYLAKAFAEAGWDLKTSLDGYSTVYILSWAKHDEDFTKLLPKVTQKTKGLTTTDVDYIASTTIFDKDKFCKIFNQLAKEFCGSLSSEYELMYTTDKRVKIPLSSLSKLYYRLVKDPDNDDTEIYRVEFVKEVQDILDENGWVADPKTLSIKKSDERQAEIAFEYKGTE